MNKKLGFKHYLTIFSSFLTLGLCLLLASCNAPDSDLASSAAGTQAGEELSIQDFIPTEPEGKVVDLSVFLEEGKDFIMNSYRDPALKEKVIVFFGELTGSHEIAEVVLINSDVYSIDPALAFALCAEESSYNPQALNHNRNNTIDRGLFQLNSASFPHITAVDFFDIKLNTRYGLSHLRLCLDVAGTEVAALAMYNAGTNRVNAHGTPKHTLDYVSRILNRQYNIERLFLAEYPNIILTDEIAEDHRKEPFRLNLLTPLGGR